MKTFLCIDVSIFFPPSKLNPKRKEFGGHVNHFEMGGEFFGKNKTKSKQKRSLSLLS